MTSTFKPTHRITWRGNTEARMAYDGVLYSSAEWYRCESSSWEIVAGEVLFHGQVPVGECVVEVVP